MKPVFYFSLLALLALFPTTENKASVQVSAGIEQNVWDKDHLRTEAQKHHKPGIFQRFKAIRALKKLVKEQALEDETASKLAKIAVAVFAGSIALGVLSKFWEPLGFVALAGFLASNTMAIMILFMEKNKRSLRIARTILITSLVFILLSILLVIAIFLLFASIFGL